MNKRRLKRKLEKRIVVYCEGQTEKHYMNGLRAWLAKKDPSTKVKIETVDIKGGGYKAVLNKLRVEPDSNCIARLVVVDFDRYINIPEEREAFKQLLAFSCLSVRRQVPVVLVVSNANFEYPLCCHDRKYQSGDTAAFLESEWGYGKLDDVKADEGIWRKAHEQGRSHDAAIRALAKRPELIRNDLKITKSTFSVNLSKVEFDEDCVSAQCSNMKDLFRIVLFDDEL